MSPNTLAAFEEKQKEKRATAATITKAYQQRDECMKVQGLVQSIRESVRHDKKWSWAANSEIMAQLEDAYTRYEKRRRSDEWFNEWLTNTEQEMRKRGVPELLQQIQEKVPKLMKRTAEVQKQSRVIMEMHKGYLAGQQKAPEKKAENYEFHSLHNLRDEERSLIFAAKVNRAHMSI